MQGFTPEFFLQVVIAVGSAGAVYGAIRADLRNLARSLDEERRIREQETARLSEDLRETTAQVYRLEGQIRE